MSVLVNDGDNSTLVNSTDGVAVAGSKRMTDMINRIEEQQKKKQIFDDMEEASGDDQKEFADEELVGGDALESKGQWSGVSGVYSQDYDYQGEDDRYNADICPYPTYYTYFTVLILLGATLLAQVR